MEPDFIHQRIDISSVSCYLSTTSAKLPCRSNVERHGGSGSERNITISLRFRPKKYQSTPSSISPPFIAPVLAL